MEVISSKTGSTGNASVVSDDTTMLQIDCGIAPDKVNAEIKYKLPEISGILCTHAHTDHISHIERYLKFGMKVYANGETWLKTKISSSTRNAMVIEAGKQFNVGTFMVKPFNVAHTNSDGSNCPNFGFLLYSTVTKEKMLWITDAAYIESKFPPMDYICIECNYIDVEDYSKELEYTNKAVEKRRFNSHLSLSRCIDFLKKQDLSKVKEVRLLHLTKSQGEIKDEILSKMHSEFPSIDFII